MGQSKRVMYMPYVVFCCWGLGQTSTWYSVSTAGTIIRVPYHVVNSRKLVWRWGTRSIHLPVRKWLAATWLDDRNQGISLSNARIYFVNSFYDYSFHSVVWDAIDRVYKFQTHVKKEHLSQVLVVVVVVVVVCVCVWGGGGGLLLWSFWCMGLFKYIACHS